MDDGAWLTDDLQKEIMEHYPQPNDIKGGNLLRNKESFSKHCAELFPPGRKFASYVQLWALVELFLKAWGASGSHGSSRITCFYGKLSKQSKPSVVDIGKQRIHVASLKDQMCPFKIPYAFLDRKGPDKKEHIYYQVKITSADYNHTCVLAPESLRLALKGACKLIPDLGGLQDVLSILREHPQLDHKAVHSPTQVCSLLSVD
jgi:hypothetical protein